MCAQYTPTRAHRIAHDLHPDYPSTRLGLELAARWGVDSVAVATNKFTRALSSADGGGTSLKFTNLSASGSPAIWNTGDWVSATYLTEAAMPIGSIIYQCNIKGQCLCYGVGIALDMMVAGYGSDDGVTCFGKRLTDSQDQGRLKTIGLLTVWGVRCTEDANNMVNGYVLYESAYNPSGFPRITS